MDSYTPGHTASTGASRSTSLPRLNKSHFDSTTLSVEVEDGVESESEVEEDDNDWQGMITDDPLSSKDSLQFGSTAAPQPLQ